MVPERLGDVFPDDKFQKQKIYRIVNYKFGLVSSTFSLLVILAVLWFQGFAFLDELVGSVTGHQLWKPLLFFGVIGLASMLVGLPFSIYETFVIEERFGFNKTTPATFMGDQIKSLILGMVIGGILLFLVVWFYHWAGAFFWLYAWGVMALFMLFFSKFYTTLILPLFNKLQPLDEGLLRRAIEAMSQQAGFSLNNVYVMDGSKRSTTT